MMVLKGVKEARAAVLEARQNGSTVGLVPTMGALHEGHLSLVRAARVDCEFVAVTIFVNPTQFGPNEDLSRYPRPLERDLDLCDREGASLVFTPTVDEMYPPGAQTTVSVAGLTVGLCGRHRPVHFAGVTTVVCKLFHILPAHRAYFGEKDYQQLVVIRQMARDLDLDIEVVGCPTVREPDGLAMSSRNAYLGAEARAQATVLNRTLFEAVEAVRNGVQESTVLIEAIRGELQAAGIERIDYVEIVHPETLAPCSRVVGPARICLAVHVGSSRLIDNVAVDGTGITE
jgi:pantoate--beta-alanine ligase